MNKSRSDVAHVEWDPLATVVCCSCWGAAERTNGPHVRSSGVGDIRATRALRGHAKTSRRGNVVRGNGLAHVVVRSDVRMLASP
jgi:hypothetical protein